MVDINSYTCIDKSPNSDLVYLYDIQMLCAMDWTEETRVNDKTA